MNIAWVEIFKCLAYTLIILLCVKGYLIVMANLVRVEFFLLKARDKKVVAQTQGIITIDQFKNEANFRELLWVLHGIGSFIILTILSKDINFGVILCIWLFSIQVFNFTRRVMLAKLFGFKLIDWVPKYNYRIEYDNEKYLRLPIVMSILASHKHGYFVWTVRGFNFITYLITNIFVFFILVIIIRSIL